MKRNKTRKNKPLIEFNDVKIFEKDLKNYSTLIRAIENLGWHVLGSGSYSTVFGQKHRDFVIKITYDDPKGVQWLKACAENTNENPFLPKVYEVWDVEFSHPAPTPCNFKNNMTSEDVLNQRREATVSFIERLKPLRDENLARILEKHLNFSYITRCMFGDIPQVKHLEEAAAIYYRILGNDMYLIDIQKRNIMLRGTQPVINDPISSNL